MEKENLFTLEVQYLTRCLTYRSVRSISVPSSIGKITIHYKHTPILACLRKGLISITRCENEKKNINFIEVKRKGLMKVIRSHIILLL